MVSHSFFFELRARLGGHSGDLKPGVYRLKRGMSYSAALDALTKGVAPNLVQIVIPEGKSRREIAAIAGGLQGSYLAASVRSPYLNPRRYGARHARNHRGQPARQVLNCTGIGAAESKPCFLHGIVGVVRRAKYSIRD